MAYQLLSSIFNGVVESQVDSTVVPTIASKRIGHTFYRVMANSYNDPNRAAAIGVFLFYPPDGNITHAIEQLPADKIINGYVSSTDYPNSDGIDTNGWMVFGNNSGPGYLDIVVPSTIKLSKITFSIITPAANQAKELCNYSVQVLTPNDLVWRQLAAGKFSNNGQNTFEFDLSDDFSIFALGVPTFGYKPQIDYTGQLPAIPLSFRGKPDGKTSVILRWTGNSDDKRQTFYDVYRKVKDSVDPSVKVGSTVPVAVIDGDGNVTYKNPTIYTDTIPDTTVPVSYIYGVIARNAVGSSISSDLYEVTSLTDDEVYLINCQVPGDHIPEVPRRSYPLFAAREILAEIFSKIQTTCEVSHEN